MADEEFDVEKYRLEHESSAEWGLRRPFLLAHHDKFDETRLICLSSCFINVEMYGCSYPPGVMEQLRFLTDEIQDDVQEFQQKVKERTTVKFVKASEEGMTVETSTSSADPKTLTPKQEAKNRLLKPLDFVKSSDSLGSSYQKNESGISSPKIQVKNLNDIKNNDDKGFISAPAKPQRLVSPNEVNLIKLGGVLHSLDNSKNDSASLLHMAVQKSHLQIEYSFHTGKDNLFCCETVIDSVCVSRALAQNKKLAKQNASSEAIDTLANYLIEVYTSNGRQQVKRVAKREANPIPECVATNASTSFNRKRIASKPLSQAVGNKRKRQQTKTLSEFLLTEHFSSMLNTNPLAILQHSGDFNKATVSYNFREAKEGVNCQLELLGHVLAEITCDGRANAKLKAAACALEKLRQTNWTLLIKQAADTSDERLSKTEVVGDEAEKTVSVIPETNIGNKLLKMMGWKGGGIGAEGNKGIEEPVSVSGVVNREGLGLQSEKGVSTDFLPKIKQVIVEFLRSDREDDLAFAPDFAKEERALIHKEAQKLGLKSHSHGTGDNRFLVLSRKRNASELFAHVMRAGGETSKYRLIAPGDHPGLGHGGEGMQWLDEDASAVETSEADDGTSTGFEGAGLDSFYL